MRPCEEDPWPHVTLERGSSKSFHKRNMFRLPLNVLFLVVLVSTSSQAMAAPGALAPLRERAVKKVELKPIIKKKPNVKRRRKPPKPPAQPFAPEVVKERPHLSPDELVSVAFEYHAKIEALLTQVRGLVSEAQKRSDPFRLNCLMDKLFQVQNHRLLAGSAMGRFNAAVIAKETASAFRNFGLLANAHQAALHYSEEAAGCPTQADFQGPNSVLVTDKPIPNSDMPVQPAFPVPERPPGASPVI